MRKILGIAMPVLLVLTVVTGIAESHVPHDGPPEAHIFIAVLFITSMCAHVWLNRKALIKYYNSPGKD